jgi:hypothetical protein
MAGVILGHYASHSIVKCVALASDLNDPAIFDASI